MSISWSMPWLLLIALQPFIILAFRYYLENKRLTNYASKKLQPWVIIAKNKSLKNHVFLRNVSYTLAWILFAVAAAGPRLAEELPVGINHTGQDIIIALDISQSMHATDLKPSRLKQAHRRIKKIVEEMKQSRIGIVVYAAKPHLYVPLSYDKDALNFYIKNLNLLVPPSQGSKPLEALAFSNNILINQSRLNSNSQKIIIHITDTDTNNKPDNNFNEFASTFSKSNTLIYTLSMASKQGEAIPAFKEGWVNNDGQAIISRPNYSYYKSLNAITNGMLVTYSIDGSDIDSIMNEIKSLTNKPGIDSDFMNWHELFYWFLIPGIFFLFVSMSPYRPKSINSSLPNSLLLVIFVITLSSTGTEIQANQASTLREAHQALLEHDYIKARELYSSIDSYQARYGEAVSAYRLNNYPRAIRLFEQAILLAKLDIEFSDTLYNLGNSYFQVGNYKHAINSFEAALLYMPNNKKTTQNILFSKRALQAVEDRAKLLALKSNPGRGPRTARAIENIEINENNNISLDNSDSEDITSIGSIRNHEQTIPELIILKGLEFAQSSPSSGDAIDDSNSFKLSPSTNSHQLINLHDNQAELWKRIFELEENFPAPLSEPEAIPGVSPW